MRGHESEIILFEASAEKLKKLGTVLMLSTERMGAKPVDLISRKEILYAEYTSTRDGAKEYETIKQNAHALLSVPKEQEQTKRYELNQSQIWSCGIVLTCQLFYSIIFYSIINIKL